MFRSGHSAGCETEGVKVEVVTQRLQTPYVLARAQRLEPELVRQLRKTLECLEGHLVPSGPISSCSGAAGPL